MGLPVGMASRTRSRTPSCAAPRPIRRSASRSSPLSLRAPRWSSDLERRYVEPLARRVFGGYLELEYVRMLESIACRRTSR
jgi:hypothetical protein